MSLDIYVVWIELLTIPNNVDRIYETMWEVSTLEVLCPKHKINLETEYITLTVLQQDYSVVIGHCPLCQSMYINKRLWFSDGRITIGKHSYEYLNVLDLASQKEEVRKRQQAQKELRERLIAERDKIQAAQKQRELEETEHLYTQSEQKQRKNEPLQRKTLASHQAQESKIAKRLARNIKKEEKRKELEKVKQKKKEVEILVDDILAGRTSSVKTSSGITVVGLDEYIDKHDIPHFVTTKNTLYICKGLILCKKHNHHIESVTGIILGKNSQPIKINTNYCPQCKKYFISYDEYMHYRNLYGIILGNFKISKNSILSNEYNELADESPLYLCSYTVNQHDNLSLNERHFILQCIIDNKILSKAEVITYLNSFIRRNRNNKNMQNAITRWVADLEWIRNYHIDNQRFYEITQIIKNN